MKSYTDIAQSKKLAEILQPESADMCWGISDETLKWKTFPYLMPWRDYTAKEHYLPCWSLAALFKLLPKCIEGAEPSLIKTFRDDYRIVYDIHGDENITSEDYTNPIDACIEMIFILKEKDLI